MELLQISFNKPNNKYFLAYREDQYDAFYVKKSFNQIVSEFRNGIQQKIDKLQILIDKIPLLQLQASIVNQTPTMQLDTKALVEKIFNSKEPLQIFVAMPFASEMNDTFDTIQQVETILKKDYPNLTIYRVDKQYGDSYPITQEILDNIKKSRIMIADLTLEKPNVYYEAGYADALEKKVVLIQQEREGEKLHFDLMHRKVIIYKSYATLRAELTKNLEAILKKLHE